MAFSWDARPEGIGEQTRTSTHPERLVAKLAAVDHQVVVIPKSATPERIAANFDVFGFSLTDEERARIDGLSATRRR